MTPELHTLDLAAPALPAVARWLLAHRPGPDPADLAEVLVLLPSQRACAQLQHALLDVSGEAALLLPWITTPARLHAELTELCDLADPTLPHPTLRPLLLAPRLAALPWLRERPDAAAGLAAELVDLFDDLRLAGEARVLDGAADEELLRHAAPGSEHVVAADLARVREAWSRYREVLPRDQVDAAVAALARAGRRWPGQAPRLVAAAHLGRLDGATARLLGDVAAAGVPVHWLAPSAASTRARQLLASYRDDAGDTHPLATMAALATRVCGRRPAPPAFTADDVPGRLEEIVAAGTPVRLQPCHDPEHESRVVTAAVCEALRGGDPVPDVVVASPDRDLAARIAARLRDAGVDVDDTRGRPLPTLPAGRLLRELLRVAVGGWPFGPVFELLTHPYVQLLDGRARPGHAVRAQLLEAAVRRTALARGGRQALRAIAHRDDEDRGHRLLGEFVDAAADAFAPLDRLAKGSVSWAAFLTALRAAWDAVAPDRRLGGDVEPRGDHDDVGALDDLLATLAHAAPRLADAPLPDLAAELLDLARRTEVRPRRQRHLPVRVMGLVEARLEHADLLVLAGLGQDQFPGRFDRPVFLPDPVRRAVDLPHWRRQAGRDAELFLRLLHGAPQVLVTWPRERDARPSLASPLVQRLAMAIPAASAPAAEPPLYRRERVPVDALVAAERAHRGEPEPVPAPRVAPPRRYSHTALQNHRDCPYRFLVGNALRLRRPEAVEAEFTALDRGTMAHAVMERWLRADGAGTRALAAGDGDAALAAFAKAAEAVRADRGHDLPGSDVAWRALVALGPTLVAQELARHGVWRPAALEARFEVPLADAFAWLAARLEDAPTCPEHGDVVLSGTIDRIDVRRDGAPRAAIIDYKTGPLPSRSRVTDGRELQLALYALAVEAGGLAAHLGDDRAWEAAETGFYALRSRDCGYRAFLSSGDDLVTGVHAVLDQVRAILDPATPYALVPEWQEADAAGRLPCHTCEFRGVCRLEERDTSPALAARVATLLAASPRRQP